MEGRKIKKIGLLLISIIALQLFLTLFATGAQISQTTFKNLIVDIKGSGDYTSIQKAIDNAKSGSTIYVKNGEYQEIIEIKKSIALIGEEKEKTIICPASQRNKYAVLLGSNEITIRDFSIYNKAPGIYTSAVRITQSDNEIDNCNFFNTPIGIVIWSSNNVISNSKFWGCSDEGIALIGGSYTICENNEITNCVFYENCDGIELQYSSENRVSYCEFYDNTHTGIDAIASENNKNVIANCKIYNNEVHGIYLSSSHENEIIDCEVYDNKNDNIVFNKYSTNNIISFPSILNAQNDTKAFLYRKYVGGILERILESLSLLRNSRLFQRIQTINF